MSIYLTQFLRLDYNFYYGGGRYPEAIVIRLPDGSINEIKRRDIYRSHSAGIVLRIIKNTGIGLTVNYWERQSNIQGNDRNRMFIGGFLTYEF